MRQTDLREGFVGPGLDELIDVREARFVAEDAARIDDNRTKAQRFGERRQCDGNVHATYQYQRWRRPQEVDEHLDRFGRPIGQRDLL